MCIRPRRNIVKLNCYYYQHLTSFSYQECRNHQCAWVAIHDERGSCLIEHILLDGTARLPPVILPGTIVHSNVDFVEPDGCVRSAQPFPGVADSTHALAWLRERRGIRCETATQWSGEYNARFFFCGEMLFSNFFIMMMALVWEN